MRLGRLLTSTLLLGAFALAALYGPQEACAQQPKKARMLMLSTSKTFTHDPVKRSKDKPDELTPAEVAVTQIGQQTGLFTVDCTQNPADVTVENLKKYELVFLYTQGPDLGISDEAKKYFFETWAKQKGHGVIATHSASDTYGGYEPYWDFIGGTFKAHPWTSNDMVTITVHDPKHPGSKPWGDEFQIKDEIYEYTHWQPEKVRVLMSLNMGKTAKKRPYHVPVAWVKQYGEGRLFYTNLGHNVATWANPTFRESLIGGIKWVLGLEPGDATPNPDVSKAEEEKAKAAAAAN